MSVETIQISTGRAADLLLINWMEQTEMEPMSQNGSNARRVAAMVSDALRVERNGVVWRVHQLVADSLGLSTPNHSTSKLSPIYTEHAPRLDRSDVNKHIGLDENPTLIGTVALAVSVQNSKRRNALTRSAFFDARGDAHRAELQAKWGRKQAGEKGTNHNVRVPVGVWGQALRVGARISKEHDLSIPHTAVGLAGGFQSAFAAAEVAGYGETADYIEGIEAEVAEIVTENMSRRRVVGGPETHVRAHREIAHLSLIGLGVRVQKFLPELGYNHPIQI